MGKGSSVRCIAGTGPGCVFFMPSHRSGDAMSEFPAGSPAKTTPPSCAGLYPRASLFERLDACAPGSAVWICGPAGSGKSSLLASYLTARHQRTLWYRVDEGDADLGSFFHYLGAAACNAFGIAAGDLPRFGERHRADAERFGRDFFRALHAAAGGGIALVFDGLHKASGDALQAVVRQAIDETPAGNRIFVSSRAAPGDGYARLLMNRGVTVLGWDELRLAASEIAAMAELAACGLDAAEVHELHERSGGWAAGVTLMLQGRADGHRAVGGAPFRIEADHEVMFQYFAEEVFAQTEPAMRTFMLRTAWLPWIPERVAQGFAPNAATILATLRGRHYFTDRLDHSARHPESAGAAGTEPGAYRYHDLFRAFLRAWATRNLDAEAVASMRIAAADVCAREGMLETAIELYVAEARWCEAAALLTLHGEHLLKQGRHATLESWIAAFPDAEIEGRPTLALWCGLCRAGRDAESARPLFERAFDAFRMRDNHEGALRAWCAVTDISISPVSGLAHLERYVQWLEAHYAVLPEHLPPALRVRTANNMRRALWLCRGSSQESERWGELADAHIGSVTDVDAKVEIAEARMAEHVFWSGTFAKAQGLYRTIAGLAEDAALAPLTRIRLAIARHCHHWSNAEGEAGLQAVREGMAIAEAAGIDSYRSLHSAVAFRYCMLLGLHADARGYLDTMAAGQPTAAVEDRMRHHVCSAWLALEDGEPAMANGHALEALRLADHTSAPCAHTLALIALAQTRYALGKPAEARTTIDWALAIARDSGSACWEYNSLVIKAYLSLAAAPEPAPSAAALSDLEAALRMGRERGFVYFNFYRPAVMRVLCSAALRHGIETDHARRLIRAYGLSAQEDADTVGHADSALHRGAQENWPWPVMIYTLRPFAVLCDGKPIRFAAKAQAKPIALLKALVAFGGERVSEALLTQILWPDAEGDRAHWVFRVTLRRLRQLLDSEGEGKAVELSDGQISLNPALVWTDVRAFAHARAALDACLQDAAQGRVDQRAADAAVSAALHDMLGLYRAHFLSQESAHEEVFLPAREKHRSHFRRAVRDAARYWEERGDWSRAADCYLRGAEIDPFAEEFYCGLMQAYSRQGLIADALRTYQRCADVLSAALDLKPGKRIQALLDALRMEQSPDLALSLRR